MLEKKATLTRRLLLGSGMTLAAAPALAASRHPKADKATAASPPDQAPPTPAQTPIGPVGTTARWAFIKDYTTGATLLSKNPDEEMTPSSLTKLMTLYITYQQLAHGTLKLDQQLPVSKKAWRMGGSKMFVRVGTTVSVEDLIRGVIVDSGNDACIVLAEAIAGSEQQFAHMMNETARKIGLTHSHFMNATGWPDPDHYMSARDIATLAADLIHRFPQYYHYFDQKSYKYNNINQQNRNPLVDRGTADGLKTGHTEAGGYGLCASAERNGRRVIEVLNGMPTNRARAEEGERLMDWAFANFEDVKLFSAGQAVDHAPVWLGTAAMVPLVSTRNLVVTLPREWHRDAKVQINYNAPIRAPVAQGTEVGSLTVMGHGVALLQVPLVAGASVGKLGLPGRAMAVLTHYVTGN